jgi:flagellar protein FliO/FliZ
MASQFVGLDQLIIIVSFLSVMMLGWLLVRRYRGRIVRNLTSGKRLRLLEETSLSPQERVRLVAVDSQHFLIVSAKGQAPSITPVELAPAAQSPVSQPAAARLSGSGHHTPADSQTQRSSLEAATPAQTALRLKGEQRPVELNQPARQPARKAPSLASAIARARAQNPALGLDK